MAQFHANRSSQHGEVSDSDPGSGLVEAVANSLLEDSATGNVDNDQSTVNGVVEYYWYLQHSG